MSWTSVLRGAGDQIELNRLVGFVGGMAYVVCANVFVAWEVVIANTSGQELFCTCAAIYRLLRLGLLRAAVAPVTAATTSD